MNKAQELNVQVNVLEIANSSNSIAVKQAAFVKKNSLRSPYYNPPLTHEMEADMEGVLPKQCCNTFGKNVSHL